MEIFKTNIQMCTDQLSDIFFEIELGDGKHWENKVGKHKVSVQ